MKLFNINPDDFMEKVRENTVVKFNGKVVGRVIIKDGIVCAVIDNDDIAREIKNKNGGVESLSVEVGKKNDRKSKIL